MKNEIRNYNNKRCTDTGSVLERYQDNVGHFQKEKKIRIFK